MRDGVVRLCEGADLVIYDTQFTPEEYAPKPHWGHSCPEDAIEIARAAGAKGVVLFHHAPERTDDQIDALLALPSQADARPRPRRRRRRHGAVRRQRSEVMEVTFWGVRGSVPAPGPEMNRYGGNTSCVELRTRAGDAAHHRRRAPARSRSAAS